MNEKDRERFLRLKPAIEAYIETGQLTVISKEMGVGPDEIIRQLNRCVSVATDGDLQGWRALIHGKRLKKYTRSRKLPKGAANDPGEFTGAFSTFLDGYPEIKRTIDNLILKRKGKIHEAKISVKRIHKTFVELCKEAGITRDQYPLNVRSCALRSIGRYVGNPPGN